MLKKKDAPIVTLAMLMLLAATPYTGFRGLKANVAPVNAQTEQALSQFTVPESVPSDTKVRMSAVDESAKLSDRLKQGFEQRYEKTQVDVTPENATAALKAVADGRTDVAIVGRPLTAEEREQGLKTVAIGRQKIAVITSADNPYAGNLSNEQFAQIFRGEISNWSAVGGNDAPIQVIDQTTESGTRSSLSNYPVFKAAPFEAASGAVKLDNDRADTIVSQLGNNGIGYVIADQALERSDIKIVPLHQVLPDDPRYSFSQPLSYVYKGPNPNDAVKAFLGYATGSEAKGLAKIPTATAPTAASDASTNASPADAAQTTSETANNSVTGDSAVPSSSTKFEPLKNPPPGRTLTRADDAVTPVAIGDTNQSNREIPGNWAWLLLPLLGVPLLGLLLKGKKRDAEPVAAASTTTTPQPHTTKPVIKTGAATPAAGTLKPNFRGAATTVKPSGQPTVKPPAIGNPAVAAAGLGAAGIGAAAAGLGAAGAAVAGAKSSSRIILVPRDCRNAYAYWELDQQQQAKLKAAGGEQLQLRLYGTGVNQAKNLIQEWDCTEKTPDRQIPIAIDNHDYYVELGYRTTQGKWLKLATSSPVKVPACERSTDSQSEQPNTQTITQSPDKATSKSHESTVASPTITQAVANPVADKADKPVVKPLRKSPDVSTAAATGIAGAAGVAAAGMAAMNRQDANQNDLPDDEAVIHQPPTNLPTDADHRRQTRTGQGSRMILVARGETSAYAYWELSEKELQQLPHDQKLSLRLYDVTDAEEHYDLPKNYQQFDCPRSNDHDMSVVVPATNRDYVAAIGYLDADDQWVTCARSQRCHVSKEKTPNAPQIEATTLIDQITQPSQTNAAAKGFDQSKSSTATSAEQGRLVIMSQVPQRIAVGAPSDNEPRAYVYWDIPETRKQAMRRQGGHQMVLRVYDATDINLDRQAAHSFRQYPLADDARDMVISVPAGDRDYVAEIGCLAPGGKLMRLLRSTHTHVPPANVQS